MSSLLTKGRCWREIQPSGSEVRYRNTSVPSSSSLALGIAIDDGLAVFLLGPLVSLPLLEAIHGQESHSRFLWRRLARFLSDYQTILQPILAIGAACQIRYWHLQTGGGCRG